MWTGAEILGGARALGAELLEALYPPVCWLCRSGRTEDGLGCRAHALRPCAFDPGEARCEGCAGLLPGGLARGLCAPCRRSPRGYRSLLAFGPYRSGSALREWILALKHGGRPELARPLGALLAGVLGPRAPSPATSVLVPVPLHALRRLERGHDQALLLARAVAEVSGVEVARALRRVRWTSPQGAAGARSRAANVRDAFRLVARARERLAGRSVFLVDDVVTSGATVRSCAAALRPAEPGAVFVLALARADRQEERAPTADTLAGSIGDPDE